MISLLRGVSQQTAGSLTLAAQALAGVVLGELWEPWMIHRFLFLSHWGMRGWEWEVPGNWDNCSLTFHWGIIPVSTTWGPATEPNPQDSSFSLWHLIFSP